MPDPRVDPATDPNALADLHAWRDAYRTRLLAPTGWWAVTNLAWFQGPSAWLGGGDGDDVRLPAGAPERLARLERDGDALLVSPSAPGALRLDGEPLDAPARVIAPGARLEVVAASDVRATFVQSGGRWGVRVFDAAQARARVAEPVAWYEPEPGWSVVAAVERVDAGRTLPIVNVLGDVRDVPVAGRLRFELAGQACTLLALDVGGRLFVNFRDATNGSETYGAGRFLTVEPPPPGTARTVLDFHRAHHPPCAHTPHAMCLLPPLANRLPLAVRAGERWPSGMVSGRSA